MKLLAFLKKWSNQAGRAASMATEALEDPRCSTSPCAVLPDIIQSPWGREQPQLNVTTRISDLTIRSWWKKQDSQRGTEILVIWFQLTLKTKWSETAPYGKNLFVFVPQQACGWSSAHTPFLSLDSRSSTPGQAVHSQGSRSATRCK